ncbi:MAG: glycosyltransferase family 2 protein [Stagnimonas sp.]|nr:glycosyltransferase family 2 protein [Stagnimonas sp.]
MSLTLSIIVPSFNQAAYLPATLDSIFQQQPAPTQVIVADGGSKDGSVEVLRRYAERYPALEWLSERDSGPAEAINRGLARARGDLIGIQSSDDLYLPGAFATVLDYFQRHPAIGLAWGDAQSITADGVLIWTGRLPAFSWQSAFARRLCIPQSSTFFRRDLLAEGEGWDARYYSCDLEFWMRLLFRTEAAKLPHVLSQWRMHPQQRTQAGKGILDGYIRMIEDSPDLARASSRLRRYAAGSVHLMALDYPEQAEPDAWSQQKHALKALLLFPESLRYNNPAHFTPALPWLRRPLALLKRLVF